MNSNIYYKWFQESLRPDQKADYREMSINQQKDWYINYLEDHYAVKNENFDLFENYEDQPENLRAITEKWSIYHANEGLDYKTCEKFRKEVQAVGYTFEYGLDAEPFQLIKL